MSHVMKSRVIFRVDDIGYGQPCETRILNLLLSNGCACSAQVVPEAITDDAIHELRLLKKQFGDSLSINQHGLAHVNFGNDSVEYEFGHCIPYIKQFSRIKRGMELMRSYFDSDFFEAFTPPFNAFDLETLRACEDLNFKVFSQQSATHTYVSKMVEIPANIDLVYDYENCETIPFRQLVDEFNRISFPGAIVCIMVHPQYLGENGETILERFVSWLQVQSESQVEFITFADLWAWKSTKVNSDTISISPTSTISNHECDSSFLNLALHNEKVSNVMGVIDSRIKMDVTPPISIEVHLTNRCNLVCRWCTEKLARGNETATLPFKALQRFLSEIAPHKVGVCLDGGGEPTLHPRFDDIITFGSNRGIHMGLITNGTNLRLESLHLLQWVRVSLDACTPDEYKLEKKVDCFNDVLEGIESLCNRKARPDIVGVSYVLNRENYHHLVDIIQKLESFGVDYFYVRTVENGGHLNPTSGELDSIEILLRTLGRETRLRIIQRLKSRTIRDNAKLPCVAHSLASVIRANGDFMLCEKRVQDPRILGNILEDDFTSIWNGQERLKATRDLLLGSSQIGCDVCRLTQYNQAFHLLYTTKASNFI